MAEAPTCNSISLKLLVDTKEQRVLFAEADKKAIDFLFHMLTLPLSTVIRLLSKQKMVGCISNLYDSIENLNEDYIQKNQTKDTLLKPLASAAFSSPLLALALPEGSHGQPPTKDFYRCDNHHYCNRYSDGSGTPCPCGYNISTKMEYCPRPFSFTVRFDSSMAEGSHGQPPTKDFYRCDNRYCNHYSDGNGVRCPCGNNINTKMEYFAPPGTPTNVAEDGGFVKGVVTYMVMDNLVVQPMSTISSITMLNKFNVKEVGALEEKVVDLGVNEALNLLKASLASKAVLTTVFLKNSGY